MTWTLLLLAAFVCLGLAGGTIGRRAQRVGMLLTGVTLVVVYGGLGSTP